jgi:hypothetical protein
MKSGGFDNPKKCVDICFHRPVELLTRDIKKQCVILLATVIVYYDFKAAEVADGLFIKMPTTCRPFELYGITIPRFLNCD